jgi:aminoglycoside phosphotransferase (APT) family kinase protein
MVHTVASTACRPLAVRLKAPSIGPAEPVTSRVPAIDQVGEPFDPSDRDKVAQAFVAALRRHRPLAELAAPPTAVTAATSTWVWFVDLAGVNLPVAWQGPLVLRIFRSDEGHVAEREDRLSTFLTAQQYPAPATHLRGELGTPAHPFVLQQRLPGRAAVDLLATTQIRAVTAELGRLQGQLHTLSTANFPLRRLTAAEYVDSDLGRWRARTPAPDPAEWLAWLRSTSTRYEATNPSDIVVCHGDFHPLNAVASTTHGLKVGIVDWTDACIADRHLDVGRSVAIYWFASILAQSRIERSALRLLRGWLARTHQRAYEAAAGTTLDPDRLRWWQIVHLYRSWLQLSVMSEGTGNNPQSTTTERFPADLREQLLVRCHAIRDELTA